ncbi:hypothetical protein K438DRAFT_1947190 [Mycena galopus ATCC 62051]|nr:hypothetical protein K438DRAFT_1947190 [Mycena galopus ATCC 62051]
MTVQLEIRDIKNRLYIAMAEVFLYGGYVVIFGFYIHVLHTRGLWRQAWRNCVLPGATILLFILCTAHLASLLVSTVLLDRAEEAGLADLEVASAENMDLVYEALVTEALITAAISIRVTNAIYVTSNVLADAIFIFRCFAIWNFRWSVIIIPTFFTIAVAALGYSASLSSIVFLFVSSIGMSFFTTVMLMGLSAGRIWWLARKARQVLGKKMISRYYTVCAMILESGALYCAGAMAFIILFVNFWTMDGSNVGDIAFSTGALLGQLVGIAPTIIAVRVGIGKSVESADSFVEMAQPRAWPCEIPAAVGSPVSIQQRVLGLLRESGDDSVKADVV